MPKVTQLINGRPGSHSVGCLASATSEDQEAESGTHVVSPHQLTPEAICSEARFWIGESIPNRYEDWPTWCPVLLGVIYSTAIVDSAGESANVPCPSGRGRWRVKITESTLVCGCHSGWRRCIQALPLSSCVILGHVLNLSKPSFICSSENRVSNGTCVT